MCCVYHCYGLLFTVSVAPASFHHNKYLNLWTRLVWLELKSVLGPNDFSLCMDRLTDMTKTILCFYSMTGEHGTNTKWHIMCTQANAVSSWKVEQIETDLLWTKPIHRQWVNTFIPMVCKDDSRCATVTAYLPTYLCAFLYQVNHFNASCSKSLLCKCSAPYWTNPLFLFLSFDTRALWRSVLSTRVPECQKLKIVG